MKDLVNGKLLDVKLISKVKIFSRYFLFYYHTKCLILKKCVLYNTIDKFLGFETIFPRYDTKLFFFSWDMP